MGKVLTLQPVKVAKKIFRSKKLFYTCTHCKKKYISDVMINYLPPNYGYYSDEGVFHCIKCWNKRFYI